MTANPAAPTDDHSPADTYEAGRLTTMAAELAQAVATAARLAVVVEILTQDRPDGEEYLAGERAYMAAWPDTAGDRVHVEQVVRVVLDAAWDASHDRRRGRLDLAKAYATASGERDRLVEAVRALAPVGLGLWGNFVAASDIGGLLDRADSAKQVAAAARECTEGC